MRVGTGVLSGCRSRGEIERLVVFYASSGMGRAEFCRSQGLAFSTLGRHLRKQRSKPSDVRSKGVERSGLVAVEVAAPAADREVRSGQREADQPATGTVGVRARGQWDSSCSPDTGREGHLRRCSHSLNFQMRNSAKTMAS